MSFTRRLYRLDEVRAALLYCLRQRRSVEANFWLTELEDSCYGGEARRILFIAWFLFVGLKRVAWLSAWAADAMTREGRQRLCWQLSRCSERDSSLWLLLCVAPLDWKGSRMLECWRWAACLEDGDCWDYAVGLYKDPRVEPLMDALQHDMRGYSTMAKATAVTLAVFDGKIVKTSWQPLTTTLPTDGSILISGDDVRHQRLHSIPYDCLFGMTWRGRGADTTEDLRAMSLDGLRACPAWKGVTGPVDSSDDSAKEGFYDEHFPWVSCDIPDEWSLADQQKSHGVGVDIRHGAPLWRWWRSWVIGSHSFLWGKPLKTLKQWVQDQRADTGASVLDTVLGLYKSLEPIEPIERKQTRYVLAEA